MYHNTTLLCVLSRNNSFAFDSLCPRTVFVLYGSQTGNSEFIASDLAAKISAAFGAQDASAELLDIQVRCSTLNNVKKTDMKAEAAAVVIGV